MHTMLVSEGDLYSKMHMLSILTYVMKLGALCVKFASIVIILYYYFEDYRYSAYFRTRSPPNMSLVFGPDEGQCMIR